MTENKGSYGVEKEITINFDNLPKNIGKTRDGKRLLSPTDVIPIADYIGMKTEGGCDTLTLEGYLPPWLWAVVGAHIGVNLPNCADTFKYRAQNGFTCDLDFHVGGL